MQVDKDPKVQLPGRITSAWDKILVVLLLGSVWGGMELVGRDWLRAMGLPHKSPLLFGLGLIVLYAAKRLVHFPGSVVAMALIAGLFKTASSHFYPCQFAAVIINGIVFDTAYTVFRRRLDSSWIQRAIAAPVIVYASYAAFAIIATFVLPEAPWDTRGWAGIGAYLASSAVSAALISIVTLNLGYYLGGVLQPRVVRRRLPVPALVFRIVSVVLVAAIWIAGQV